MPNASRPRSLPRLRQFLALATDTWLARGYLAVLAASVPVAFLFSGSVYAAGHLLLTAPLSTVGMAFPFGPGTEGGGAAEVLATAFSAVWLLVSALVNAAVLGALAHHVRDRRTARQA
ncbi:SCO4225 family membrane protein [Streptomyces sp. NPDC004609]|uniref:SCO4225 family membrane protein n=1 Tax=Streptomyces sp. NPDC004609 TaxID=3364704 RepID=UPI00368F5AF1